MLKIIDRASKVRTIRINPSRDDLLRDLSIKFSNFIINVFMNNPLSKNKSCDIIYIQLKIVNYVLRITD